MKYIILSPSSSYAGGVESLHQLAQCILFLGYDASICYYETKGNRITKDYFSNYKIKSFNGIHNIKDDHKTVIIIPENDTKMAHYFNKSKIFIFWLSIENFFPFKENFFVRNIINYLNISNKRLNFNYLKKYNHLFQSYYSQHYLSKKNISGFYIGDYINSDIKSKNQSKKNIICFNPAKGMRFVKTLKKIMKNYQFVALENMSNKEILSYLYKSKVYIDFGLHPGRDRIPREACLMGCCIITNKKGSAKNQYDIPIPKRYKFDVFNPHQIKILIDDIFKNYAWHYKYFHFYINVIRKDKINMIRNTNFFVKYLDSIMI